MPEERQRTTPGAVWRGQPEDKVPINPDLFLRRRGRELQATTRSEVLGSIIAALFFVVIVAWRLPLAGSWLQVLGFTAVGVWVLIVLYQFRRYLFLQSDDAEWIAATSVEFYRRQLEARRDYLRGWIWHGPLILAVLLAGAAFAGRLPDPAQLWKALPFTILLVVWTCLVILMRRSRARDLQRELDELNGTGRS